MTELDASQDIRPAALAELIYDARLEVERRWMARVRNEHPERPLTEPELRDSIPDYLLALVRSLRDSDRMTMQQRGGSEWSEVARKHAVTRIQLGFDIAAVIEEFDILRRVLLEVLRERAPLAREQADRVVDLTAGAVSAAVQQYIDFRDYQSRRAQAEHIGFITHELRNPLTAAIMTTGRIREASARGQDLTAALDLLDRSLTRLRNLIDQTLVSQRLEANEVELQPTNVRLGELMDQALKAADAVAARKGVELHTTYDAEVLLHVDVALALSAVQNIVDNAAKFTDAGRIDVEVDDAPSEAVFHVRDACGGISSEELRTLFEPFKRGHQAKSGSGLGLSIARRAIEAHGKKIFAESTDDKGCHFWFALPKATH